jgi:hypothetical protein
MITSKWKLKNGSAVKVLGRTNNRNDSYRYGDSFDATEYKSLEEAYTVARKSGYASFKWRDKYLSTSYNSDLHEQYQRELKAGYVDKWNKENPNQPYPLLTEIYQKERELFGNTNADLTNKIAFETTLPVAEVKPNRLPPNLYDLDNTWSHKADKTKYNVPPQPMKFPTADQRAMAIAKAKAMNKPTPTFNAEYRTKEQIAYETQKHNAEYNNDKRQFVIDNQHIFRIDPTRPFINQDNYDLEFGVQSANANDIQGAILNAGMELSIPYVVKGIEMLGNGAINAVRAGKNIFNKTPAKAPTFTQGVTVGKELSIPFETHAHSSAITKANRMLAQEDKILKYHTPGTLEKFKAAARGNRLEILSHKEYINKYNEFPISPGYNKYYSQAIVIKDWFEDLMQITVPRFIETIAAHEIDHLYAPLLEEAEELHKIFDLGILEKKAMEMETLANVATDPEQREYFKGYAEWYRKTLFDYFNGYQIRSNGKVLVKDGYGNKFYVDGEQYVKYNSINPSTPLEFFTDFGNGIELRARVGQLKELIGKHNGYDLSKNFPVTKEDLDWVLENYFTAGGENNAMDIFFELLADKELLLKYMNKYALSIIPAAGIMYGVSKDEETEKEVKQ